MGHSRTLKKSGSPFLQRTDTSTVVWYFTKEAPAVAALFVNQISNI